MDQLKIRNQNVVAVKRNAFYRVVLVLYLCFIIMSTNLTYLFPLIVYLPARDNTSAVIEVRLRPKHARWRYNMDVFADSKRIYFDRPSLRVQHFPGLDFKVIIL